MDRGEAIGLLRAAAGELDAILALVEGTDPCIEVIRRIGAIQSRLWQVHDGLLESHMAHCLTAAQQDDASCLETLDEIWDVFCWKNKSDL